MMPKVLISAGPLRNKPGRFRDMLQEAGFSTVEPPGEDQLTPEDLERYLPGCSAVIAGMEPYTEWNFDHCPELRVIARTGVGYDAVDVPAATRHRVVLAITPGTNQESVAEQTFALLLGVCRRVALNDRIIRAGGWDRTLVIPLRGKTIGLFGLGRIGRAMVPRAQAFGMTVIACDPYLAESPASPTPPGVRLVDFDTLVAESDILSVHCPLTPDTKGLFKAQVFERMKPGSIFLNTSRGALVNEVHLHRALAQGPLAGAGLDVLDPEPPDPRNSLFQLHNLVLSPHIAGIDTLAMSDMAEKAASCIVALYQKGWPADCIVNRDLAPHWKW